MFLLMPSTLSLVFWMYVAWKNSVTPVTILTISNLLSLSVTSLYQIGWEFVLRWIVFYVFYPVTVPGMILLSTCGLYPCGAWVGMEGDDEEEDENYAKGMQLLEYIGINPWLLSLYHCNYKMLTMLMF